MSISSSSSTNIDANPSIEGCSNVKFFSIDGDAKLYSGFSCTNNQPVLIKVVPNYTLTWKLKRERLAYESLKFVKGLPKVLDHCKLANGAEALVLTGAGPSILHLLKFGGFDAKFVVNFGIQALNILEDIHDLSVVHGDVHLKNFLLGNCETEDCGTLYLAGFDKCDPAGVVSSITFAKDLRDLSLTMVFLFTHKAVSNQSSSIRRPMEEIVTEKEVKTAMDKHFVPKHVELFIKYTFKLEQFCRPDYNKLRLLLKFALEETQFGIIEWKMHAWHKGKHDKDKVDKRQEMKTFA